MGVCLFALSILILLSRESDGGVIFWTNPHPLRSCLFSNFPLFLWLLTIEFAAYSKPPSRENYRKEPYPRTQQRVRRGWELNLHHAIVITRSPKKNGALTLLATLPTKLGVYAF